MSDRAKGERRWEKNQRERGNRHREGQQRAKPLQDPKGCTPQHLHMPLGTVSMALGKPTPGGNRNPSFQTLPQDQAI